MDSVYEMPRMPKRTTIAHIAIYLFSSKANIAFFKTCVTR